MTEMLVNVAAASVFAFVIAFVMAYLVWHYRNQ